MNFIKEAEAIKSIAKILTSLDEEGRGRVLTYALNAFGMQASLSKEAGRPFPEQHPKNPQLERGTKKLSAQEYLCQYHYKIMTKRIAVVAVYLEREKETKRFAFRDITDVFRDAKEPKIPAQSQYIRAVIMGYLAKEGDQYYATTRAEKLVDDYLGKPPGEEVASQ